MSRTMGLIAAAAGLALGNQNGHGRGKDLARVAGYRVTCEYAGRQYVTRMPYDPGERIRVRVAVTPT